MTTTLSHLNLVDALNQGIAEQLALPLTSHQLSVWYGIASTEISAARRREQAQYEAQTFVLSDAHRLIGLDLAHYALQYEYDEAEMAMRLGWHKRKYISVCRGTAQLELLDLIKIKRLGIDVVI